MGTENPNRSNFPQRPAATPFAAPQSTTPFISSHPMVGSEASAFRPSSPPAPQTTTPFLSPGPVVGSEATGFRPAPPVRPTGSSIPGPPSAYGPPSAGPFQRFPTPQYPGMTQVPPPQASSMGQPVFPQQVKPPAGQVPSMPGPFKPQPQMPSVPMGSPPQSLNTMPPTMNAPQSTVDSSYFAPRPNFQSSSPPMGPSYSAPRGTMLSAFPGYPGKQPNTVTQAPPLQSAPFLAQQGGYGAPPPGASTPFYSHQGGYAPPPPVAAPLGGPYSSEQMRPPGSAPPMGAVQGLVEDFSSLSLGSVPGSFDPGLDSKALPRPLDGDVEPSSFAERYPTNCSSRYLRLTTSAIPNSQSLVSRWHLPLGAVVCPLAEAPDGVSIYALIEISTMHYCMMIAYAKSHFLYL